MKYYDSVFLGGGLACVKGAFHLRQLKPDISIAVITNEPVLPYDRPPLSKEFLKGEKQFEEIILYPRSEYQQNQIDLILNTYISRIDATEHVLEASTGEAFKFGKLFIATGGKPRRLPVAPQKAERVCYLRAYEDALRIRELSELSKNAAIIGGGFIGLELATALADAGLEVHVFDQDPWLWKRFLNKKIADRFLQFSSSYPVHFHFNSLITDIKEHKDKVFVTDNEKQSEFDFVCIGIGIELNLELAKMAGCEINRGVRVDSYMRTSVEDIYAGGDITEFFDPYLERWRVVEHWGHAEYSGLVAATHMSGQEYAYDLLNYAWTDIFNHHIEMAGDISSDLEINVRGEFGSDQFILLYMKENILRGYMAVNWLSKDFPTLQKWIKKKLNLKSVIKNLSDPEIKLKELDNLLK